jgi:hypothetical protein
LGLLFITKSAQEHEKSSAEKPAAADAEKPADADACAEKTAEDAADSKPSEEAAPTYYCTHCGVDVHSASELTSHLEARHQTFLENLFKLFPQAAFLNYLFTAVFRIRIRIRIRWAPGSGSRRGKISPKKEEKVSLKTRNFFTN